MIAVWVKRQVDTRIYTNHQIWLRDEDKINI